MSRKHSGRRHSGRRQLEVRREPQSRREPERRRQPEGRRRADVPVRTGSHASLAGGFLKLVLLSLVVGAVLYGALRYTHLIGGDDYSGTGTGSVQVVIKVGATGQQIGELLEQAGVVKSAQTFYQTSLHDKRSAMIQPGTFRLHKKMSSEAAMDALLNRANRVEMTVVVPEGSRVGQIVDAIAAGSNLSKGDVKDALDNADELGLPKAAHDNPEGYLFPATYTVEPGMSAKDLLRQMVAQTLKVEQELNIEERAKSLNMSSEDILTVASILEFEARRTVDYPKVARVLYNRLDSDAPLQLDSTVSYLSKRKGDVWTTPAERANPSDYNTYQHIGLPPGPIGSPGKATIEAALNPADGDWLYFLADKKGVTHFSKTYEQHVKQCHQIYGSQTKC